MPIKQETVHNLLVAAEDCLRCWQRMKEIVKGVDSDMERGLKTPEEAYYDLFSKLLLIQPQPESAGTIAMEREHYRLTVTKNMLNRRYMEERRHRPENPDDRLARPARSAAAVAYINAQKTEDKLSPEDQAILDQYNAKQAQERAKRYIEPKIPEQVKAKDGTIRIMPRDDAIATPDDFAPEGLEGLSKEAKEAIQAEVDATAQKEESTE